MQPGSIATAAMDQAHPESTSYGQVIEYIQGMRITERRKSQKLTIV